MVVDWLKHGFITKFNHVKTTIYERYTDVLCKDILLAAPTSRGGRGSKVCDRPYVGKPARKTDGNHTCLQRRTLLTDRSTLVTRRLGFAALPLACLMIRISAQAFGMVWSNAIPAVTEDASRSALADTFEKWWRPVSTTLVFVIGWFW